MVPRFPTIRKLGKLKVPKYDKDNISNGQGN